MDLIVIVEVGTVYIVRSHTTTNTGLDFSQVV